MKKIAFVLLALLAVVGTKSDSHAASCCAKRKMMMDYLQYSQYKQSMQYGYKKLIFNIEGREAFVILPNVCNESNLKPWIWYAPTFANVLPGDRQEWIFSRLLEKGFAIGGIDVGESFGSIKGREIYTKFYQMATEKFKLAPKASLWAQSRGGLMLFNWASDHPEYVACIGATYPICKLGTYTGYELLAKTYEISEDELQKRMAEFNPLDRLEPLAKRKIPILSLHGNKDTVVPLEENSLEMSKRYKALGGNMQLIVVDGKGHEEVDEFFESQAMLDFFLNNGIDKSNSNTK